MHPRTLTLLCTLSGLLACTPGPAPGKPPAGDPAGTGAGDDPSGTGTGSSGSGSGTGTSGTGTGGDGTASTGGGTGGGTGTGGTGTGGDPPLPVPDFQLVDLNTSSPRVGQTVSPRDYLEQVSGWYFIHST